MTTENENIEQISEEKPETTPTSVTETITEVTETTEEVKEKESVAPTEPENTNSTEEIKDELDEGVEEDELKEIEEIEKVTIEKDNKPHKPGLEDYVNDPDYDKLIYDENEQLVKYMNDLTGVPDENAIDTFNFDDPKIKKFFFDMTSDFSNNKPKIKEGSTSNILETLSELTKVGRHIDVYLPASNLVVRTYEFDNALVVNSSIALLNEDFDFKRNINSKSTQSKKFVERIIEYSEILSKDGRKMNEDDLKNISNSDMDLLMLSVVRLLSTDTDHDKDPNKPVTITVSAQCPNCQKVNSLELDMDKLIRKQYTKDIVEYANKNFSLEDTIEGNLSRSKFKKAKGVRFRNDKVFDDGTLTIMVKLSEPSFAKMKEIEDKVLPHILSKYEETGELYELTSNAAYSSANLKGKLGMVAQFLQRQARFAGVNGSWGTQVEFDNDNLKLYTMMYIESIVILKEYKEVPGEAPKKPEVLSSMNVYKLLTQENDLEDYDRVLKNIDEINATLDRLPSVLMKDLTAKINELSENSITEFKQKYTCQNSACKHEDEPGFRPIDLVFSRLQNL